MRNSKQEYFKEQNKQRCGEIRIWEWEKVYGEGERGGLKEKIGYRYRYASK